MSGGTGISLTGELPWTAGAIPGSTLPVELVRLASDPATRSATLLVRFPPGWERPDVGHYPAGEEIVVLRGELAVSGVSYHPGDYGWIPAGALREASRTPQGALVLAWFAGAPRWTPGPGRPAGERRRRSLYQPPSGTEATPFGTLGRLLRGRRPGEDPGESWLLAGLPDNPVPAAGDVLDLTDVRWWRLRQGDRLPRRANPVFARLLPPGERHAIGTE